MATNKEPVLLYNGEVEITFFPDSHRYKLDGQYIKSVTKVLSVINKPQLLKWATDLARAYLKAQLIDGNIITTQLIDEACSMYTATKDEAADTGKIIHAWIEEFAKAKISGEKKVIPLPEQDQAANGVLGFMEWYKNHQIEFTFSEKLVFSRKNNYVGTSDVWIKIKDIEVGWVKYESLKLLSDVKSSKAIYADYILQEIAYLEADEEENGVQYDGVATLRFEKGTGEEGEIIEKPFDIFILLKTDPLYQACYQAFLGALHLQKTLEEAEKLLKDRN